MAAPAVGGMALGVGWTGTVPLELWAGGAPVGLGLKYLLATVMVENRRKNVPVVADNGRGDGDRAGDGARAVRDGQGGGSGDGPGLGAVGDLGGLGAVGGVDVDNLGGDGDVGVGRGTSGDGEDGGDGELHFVGIRFLDSKSFEIGMLML